MHLKLFLQMIRILYIETIVIFIGVIKIKREGKEESK